MNSRHCDKCVADWPKHHISCPVCNTPCPESSKQPMDETEYRWLLATKKGRFFPLPKAEEDRVIAEWDALEAEVLRRGIRWTIPDLVAEGFSVRVAS